MGLIRSLITFVVLIVVIYVGATVKLGNRTFWQHVSRIWQSDETQELVEGVKEESGPMVDRISRGVKAGVKAAATKSPDAGPSAGGDTQ